MDGTIGIKFKNGKERLLTHVTSFDFYAVEEGRRQYKINMVGVPALFFDEDDVERFLMW